jgi:hypothetical protein
MAADRLAMCRGGLTIRLVLLQMARVKLAALLALASLVQDATAEACEAKNAVGDYFGRCFEAVCSHLLLLFGILLLFLPIIFLRVNTTSNMVRDGLEINESAC